MENRLSERKGVPEGYGSYRSYDRNLLGTFLKNFTKHSDFVGKV